MFRLGQHEIGPDHPPFIIAEIGINHGGDLSVAKHMADLAAQSGAHCIKHQTHFVEDEMTDDAKSIIPPNADISIWEIMAQCALSADDEIKLKEHVEALGLVYLSTPFSRKAANFLQEIGVIGFKIGSGEADNFPLINHIAGFGKPVIMSTGMQSIGRIREAVDIFRKKDTTFALLECTNLYPSPPENVSLKGITELQDAFPDICVGFSDHSIGVEMALASVALGACIIERHFTDSRYRKGPDISCSCDPQDLRKLVNLSKEIHIARSNDKQRTEEEEDVYKFARGSVVADRDLAAGTIITEEDIWARRPGTGEIPAYDFEKLIGKKVRSDIARNTQLRWSDFQ